MMIGMMVQVMAMIGWTEAHIVSALSKTSGFISERVSRVNLWNRVSSPLGSAKTLVSVAFSHSYGCFEKPLGTY